MEEGPPKKNQEELEAEYDQLETEIMDLILKLDSTEKQWEARKLDDHHFELVGKLHRGEISIEEAILESKRILKVLQSLKS